VITQDVSFLAPKYAKGGRQRFVEELVPKLAQIPGVEFAGATSTLPLRGEDWLDSLVNPDVPRRADDEAPIANFRFVTPGYFEAMGIRLIEGRYLNASDKNQLHAVISQQSARRLFRIAVRSASMWAELERCPGFHGGGWRGVGCAGRGPGQESAVYDL